MKPKMTTIAISQKNADSLRKMIHGREDYNDVLTRLIADSVDVWVDVIMVDGQLPQLHTVVFQLGEDKHSLYYYNGERMEPLSLEEANALLANDELKNTREAFQKYIKIKMKAKGIE